MSLRQDILAAKQQLAHDLRHITFRDQLTFITLNVDGDHHPTMRQQMESLFQRWTRSRRFRPDGYIAVQECRLGIPPHIHAVLWGDNVAVPPWPIGDAHVQSVYDLPGLVHYFTRHLGSAGSVRRLRREGLTWLVRSRGVGRPNMVI